MTSTSPGMRPATILSASTLRFDLRLRNGASVIGSERVRERDLVDAHAEVWLEAFLRRGMPGAAREDLAVELEPVHVDAETLDSDAAGEPARADGRPVCIGFSLTAMSPAGDSIRRLFGRDALEHVVQRASRRLVAEGALEEGDLFTYELCAGSREPVSDADSARASVRVVGAPERTTIETLARPLALLLDRAELVGGTAAAQSRPMQSSRTPAPYPVLFTRDAFARAERVSRRGGGETPPIETGGLLVGPLCSCPETGELFAVVTDVLEAREAQGTTYTLTYSGSTWQRVQTVLRAMRAQPGRHAHRILGQCHGHEFPPSSVDGGTAEPCAECSEREICTRTTAFLSADDLAWSRAVFHGEPWQLGQIFGRSARGEAVDALFGQRRGRLVRREHHLIDAFDL